MARSIVQIGRLFLTESESRTISDISNRDIQIAGAEITPYLTIDSSKKIRNDIMGLTGRLLPVIFEKKTFLNGYYIIKDASDEIESWFQGAHKHEWKLILGRIGEDTEVDLESRLSGALSRINDHAVVGERWHAPSIGHTAYFTGATAPTVLTRATSDGNITVYRAVPITLHPRWSCSLANYELGRVRFLDDMSRERVGLSFDKSATSWTLTNAMTRVKISSGTGVFEIASRQATETYVTKNWDIQINAVSIGKLPISCNVIRNDHEVITIRLTYNVSPSGRMQVDITLRRGSRFAEFFVSYPYSATIKFVLATAEAATAFIGGVRATANDGSGNRYVIGSLKTSTADLTNGGISKASVVNMDVFIGTERGGTAAVVGDQAANLMTQYVGVSSERVVGFRR